MSTLGLDKLAPGEGRRAHLDESGLPPGLLELGYDIAQGSHAFSPTEAGP